MCVLCCFFLFLYCCFFKQKTAYERRISDWSADVCSSDLVNRSTDDYVDNAAIEEPIDDPKPGLRTLGYGCTQAALLRAAAPSEADTIKYTLLEGDRKSVVKGKSVSVRVDLGGSRIIKTKKIQEKQNDELI